MWTPDEMQMQTLRMLEEASRGMERSFQESWRTIEQMRRMLESGSLPSNPPEPSGVVSFDFNAWIREMTALGNQLDELHRRAQEELFRVPGG